MSKFSSPNIIIFDWNQGNLEHIKKHDVVYEECEDVFFNDPVYFTDEKHSEKEERILAYGITSENRLLTVVFTIRDDKIRVVSARDQNKKEREVYKLHKKS